MEAILLHHSSPIEKDLCSGFSHENICTASVGVQAASPLPHDIYDKPLAIVIDDDTQATFQIVQTLHTSKESLTICVICEHLSDERTRELLQNGADLIIPYPCEIHPLAQVLKNIVYQKEIHKNAIKDLDACNVHVDRVHRTARRANRIVPLRNKELELLEFFLMNANKVLTRSTILEYVWDRNAQFASNTLDVHVNRLRRKLDDPFQQKLIHTIHCVGYRFSLD